jgi:WD40 repeat protein
VGCTEREIAPIVAGTGHVHRFISNCTQRQIHSDHVGYCPLVVWDSQTGQQIFTLNNVIGPAVFTPDSKFVVTTDLDGIVFIALPSGKVLETFPTGAGDKLQIAPDGKHLFMLDDNGTLKVWDVQSKESFELVLGRALYAKFSTDSQSIFTADDGEIIFTADDGERKLSQTAQKLRQWDVATGKELRSFTFNDPSISQKTSYLYYVSDNDQFLLTEDLERSALDLWDISTGTKFAVLC